MTVRTELDRTRAAGAAQNADLTAPAPTVNGNKKTPGTPRSADALAAGESGKVLPSVIGSASAAAAAAAIRAALGDEAPAREVFAAAAALSGKGTGTDLTAADVLTASLLLGGPGQAALATGALGVLNTLAYSDPAVASRLHDVLDDWSMTINNMGAIGSEALAEREAWVPLMLHPEIRDVVMPVILDELRSKSARLEAALKDAPKEQRAWDVVFIGAGANTAAAANALTRSNPNTSQLVLESSDLVAKLMAEGGTMLTLNSINTQVRVDRPSGVTFKPGDDYTVTQLPAEGPVQSSDLSSARLPEIRVVAQTAAVSLATSSADVLMKTRPVSVTRTPDGRPAKYAIELSSGQTVYANAIGVSTGLGQARVRLGDEETTQLIERTVRAADYGNPDAVPGIVTFPQWKALADLSTHWRDPYRQADDVAIIGMGESGVTTCLGLLGLGPTSAGEGGGNLDRPQRGDVARLHWIVGKDGPKDAAGLAKIAVGGTYGTPAPDSDPRDKALLHARSFALHDYVVDEPDREANARARGTLQLTAGRTRSIREVQENGKTRYAVTSTLGDGTERTVVVDRIILCTGFESTTSRLFDALLPEGVKDAEDYDAMQIAQAKVRGDEKSRTNVAYRIPGEEVYVFGINTSYLTPRRVAFEGKEEVGLNAQIPRAAALGAHILAKKQGLRPVRGRGVAVEDIAARGPAQATLCPMKADGVATKMPVGLETFVLKVELGAALRRARLRGLDTLSLTLRRSGDSVVLESNADCEALARLLSSNKRLLDAARRLTRIGKPIAVTCAVQSGARLGGDDGALKLETLGVTL